MSMLRYLKIVFPYILLGNTFTSFAYGKFEAGAVNGILLVFLLIIFHKENKELMKLSYEDEIK